MGLAITGADGFVGRAVASYLAEIAYDGEVRLYDRAFTGSHPFATFAANLSEPQALRELVEFADCVIHLAALPGGAAQSDPQASRRTNLDLPLDLSDRLGGKRLILASSIAVLGSNFDGPVGDDTPAKPDSVYGTHKRMAELAFADALRRGALSGVAVRLPGVVARPAGTSAGFGSAFLSEVFHAAAEGRPFVLPVAPDATCWMISARKCAANLVHMALSQASEAETITMPALHVRMGDLLAHLAMIHTTNGIVHDEQPAIRRAFGSYPPLETARGQRLGMSADADLTTLIQNTYSQLKAASREEIR